MNELQVKTLQFEPAKVEFNFQELFATLDQNLKKYEGLTFTEDDIPEAKKTVADLRKGKKAVDSYRLQTKKKLTKSVTEFEEQCKELNKKFDQVVTPLVSQIEKFEEDRKEEKRKQIQSFIDKLISEQNISSDYSSELIVESDFLTKGKSMKSIKEELTLKAEALVLKQQKFEGDKEIIENTVEIANNRYKTNLLSSAYVKLLQYKEVKEIKTLILDDAQEEVQKRLEKECEQETKTATVIKEKTAPVKDEQTFFEVYKVTGTESQLDALEEFMRQEQIEFEIKEENE
nr:DUF1351 domain-containing protein [Thalassobacillus sp. C254]